MSGRHPVPLAPQQLAIARMYLEISRSAISCLFAHDSFGTAAGDLIIVCAVLVGDLEGRPMTSTKIADYAGIPRATVIRRLRSIVASGAMSRLSDGSYILTRDAMNSDCAMLNALSNIKSVQSASTAMSRMD